MVIGIVGGLYNLVKESLAAIRDAKLEDARNQTGQRNGES